MFSFSFSAVGRYGSVESNTGKSYTQLEYEYAVSQNKPLFACVIKEDALEARVKEHGSNVIETDFPSQLKKFRAQVLSGMIKFWSDEKDIKIAIGETMAYFARRDDLSGWIKTGSEADMPALADELTRLSKENAKLRAKAEQKTHETVVAGLSFNQMQLLLKSKGVLEYLDKYRLNPGYFEVPEEEREHFREMLLLGLVRTEEDFKYAILTEEGRLFLNRFELDKIMKDEIGE